MNSLLSDRVNSVKPSTTLAITARAAEMRAAGKDIIGLGAGEPDFDTPDHIKSAAIEAINKGFTKYTAVDGTAGLKQAIIEKFKRDNSLQYTPEQILVSCGGKQSFFNLTQATINPGDEVVIPAPYWVSYPDITLLAGGNPVTIETTQAQQFKISPEQLEAAITEKTKIVVLNSPSNPTGIAYSKDELKAFAEVLLKHPNILIATDDMYEHILWQPESFCNIVNACPELIDRTMVLNGVSKAYSMTGWRIGYAAGPAAIIKAMKKIQSQSTSNPTSISQVAAEAALNSDQSCIGEMLKAFKQRHDYSLERLNKIKGIDCIAADGTFYLFPNVKKAIESLPEISDDISFAEHLIVNAGVALVPGSAFGCKDHVRISIATSMENLTAALDRIENILNV